MVVSERLGLDGLVYTPSQYHLARLGIGLAWCLDPVDEGRFRAVQTTLAGLRLSEAAAVLNVGKVIDEPTTIKFKDAWQVDTLSSKPGLTVTEMFRDPFSIPQRPGTLVAKPVRYSWHWGLSDINQSLSSS